VLLPVIFGGPFEDSVSPFLWLLPGALGFAAMVVFSNALVAAASPGLSSVGPLVSLVLGIALDVALIPRFGPSGAAAAASAAFLAGGCAALAVFRHRNPFAWRSILLPRRGDLTVFRALAGPLRLVRSSSS
jgi:O-antigen/teichoic acid export membrane protein